MCKVYNRYYYLCVNYTCTIITIWQQVDGAMDFCDKHHWKHYNMVCLWHAWLLPTSFYILISSAGQITHNIHFTQLYCFDLCLYRLVVLIRIQTLDMHSYRKCVLIWGNVHWYNLSCILHWLSVKCTSRVSVRSCDISWTKWVKARSFWLTRVMSNWQITNATYMTKLSLYHDLYGTGSKCSFSWCFLLKNGMSTKISSSNFRVSTCFYW